MNRECIYDSAIYNHRQLWALVRALTACGWTITIRACENTRPPGEKPGACSYYVEARSTQWHTLPNHRYGDTPWFALCAVFHEIILPVESGEVKP